MASPVTMTKLFKTASLFLSISSVAPVASQWKPRLLARYRALSLSSISSSQPNLGSVHHGTINGINTLLLSRFHGSKGYGRRKYPTDDDDDDDDDDDLVGEDIVDDYENDNNEFDFDDDDDDDDAPAQKRNK
ncbi:eisosome protein SEG2 [Hevea brasiliensis]|uniref:eisosome protein SEG2 n=1 Tax=Hevea brasiliensis TaxID=3981 RepID=UPI0025D2428A|nr:eisosome protein SEG2 [Hevea brasiliensis]